MIRNTIRLMIIAAVILPLGFFWFLGKKGDYLYKSKRYSHFFAKQNYFFFGLIVLFVSAFGWADFGAKKALDQAYCQSLGIEESSGSKVRLILPTTDGAMNLVLSQMLNEQIYVKAYLAPSLYINKCSSRADYLLNATESILNKERIGKAELFNFKTGKKFILTSVYDEQSNCGNIAELGYKILKHLDVDISIGKLKSDVNLPKVSCKTYDKNNAALMAYNKKKYHDAKIEALQALDFGNGSPIIKHTLGLIYSSRTQG